MFNGMKARSKCLPGPKVSPVRSCLYNKAESKAASPRKECGLIRGCPLKKSVSVGIRSLASCTDLSSSGESVFLPTGISVCAAK